MELVYFILNKGVGVIFDYEIIIWIFIEKIIESNMVKY